MSSTMRALVLADGRLAYHSDHPQPEPGPGEALVRVTRAGICATDLEMQRGYHPFTGVLGHEFTGVVARAPEPGWEGRRVAGEINIGCGECDECRAHGPAHCARRSALGIRGRDGVFAEYVALPLANLHAVPDNVSDDAAVFVEPLAAACSLLERAQIRPSIRVALLGAGRLGLLCAQVLALTGCDLTVVGRHTPGLELLRGWGIAGRDARREPLDDLARACDVVVDCTGSPDGFAQALDWLRPRGTLLLKSTYHGLPQADLSRVVVDELTIAGSRCGPFEPALRLLASGQVRVEEMIAARYPLEEGVAALERAGESGVLKVVLDI
jgi:threonine dehydrogenase-like Zn-dependent dehydrogenase